MSQVHQKSNKLKFKISESRICDTHNGSGIVLKDVGIMILGCKLSRNSNCGISVDSNSYLPPTRILQAEVKEFLKRQPMKIVVSDCEVFHNQRNGIMV